MPQRDNESLPAFEARLQREHAAYVATRSREPKPPEHVRDMDADQLWQFEQAHGLHTSWLPPRGPRVIDSRRVHADPPAPTARHVRDMSRADLAEFERRNGIFV